VRRARVPRYDIFHVSAENGVAFLDPLIESWDIDLATFGLEIVLTTASSRAGEAIRVCRAEAEQPVGEEPGLKEFLQDSSLSAPRPRRRSSFSSG